MSDVRPSHFPPGTPIGRWYTVEGLVRLSEGRMFYLVNDDRADEPVQRCWSCGDEETPRDASVCVACNVEMRRSRFLMSSRWKPSEFEPYLAYYEKKLDHPGLAFPLDVLRHEEQLLSFVPYTGEGLMLDEAAPLSNERILNVAQRLIGTLAFLQMNGVRVTFINRANLLINPDNSVRLFDVSVDAIQHESFEGHHLTEVISCVGGLLGKYCNVEAAPLSEFLSAARNRDYPTPAAFGRSIEKRFDSLAAVTFDPKIGAMSDVGLTRQLNEDNWGWAKLNEHSTLFVVADGMGGHEGGEVASTLAVDTICEMAHTRTQEGVSGEDETREMLDGAFQGANNRVKEEAEARGNDMGTTLVAMLVDGSQAFIANVGDSRAYRWRDGELGQVSVDHSLVQKMVERGRITQEEARVHPHSNILLRTVGTERDVEIDLFHISLEKGDKVLLCSDGLWGEVEDRDMQTILNTYSDPRLAARELVRASHHGGGKDNVTLLLVNVD